LALTVLSLELLNRLHAGGLLTKATSIVEIGAQQLANDFLRSQERVEALGRLFSVTKKFDLPAPQASLIVEGGAEHVPETAPLARQFWEWLGFKYAAVDIDGSPNSIPLDLNFDAVPRRVRKKFDIVTNFGTTEHVANQLNAFKVIHDLTAVGGIMIHNLPAQGFINHGLVNYNPKFFWMLARSNDYRLVHFDYIGREVPTDFPSNLVESILPYAPDIGERKARYKFDDGGLIAVLQKVRDMKFVPPLDVATGTKTTNRAMIKRYWTVFAHD